MKLSCPYCGIDNAFDDSMYGKNIKCGVCGKVFVGKTTTMSTTVRKAAKKLGEAAKAFMDATKIAAGSAHEWAKWQCWNEKRQHAKIMRVMYAKARATLVSFKYRIVCASLIIAVILLACILVPLKSSEENDASGINGVALQAIVHANFSDEKQFIEQAAAKGDVNAKDVLRGLRYAQSVVAIRDNKDTTKWFCMEAVKWFRKAAQQGDANAQYFLGIIYSGIGSGRDSEIDILLQDLHGYGVELNAKESASWYLKAAKRGHAKAQFALGWSYCLGDLEIQGVAKDYGKAVTWFHKAAGQGNVDAQWELVRCYTYGYGVKIDKSIATVWERKCAETEYKLGKCFAIGEVIRKDDVRAAEWFLNAANKGHVRAQFELYKCHLSGRGVEENKSEANKWLRKAAEQGLPEAQLDLGECYMFGQSVNKDKVKGIRWIQKAAEQDYVKAQWRLGLCYHFGDGVEKNGDEAIKWYRKAADQGYATAEHDLGIIYVEGKIVEANKKEALRWLRKADAHGNIAAHNRLQWDGAPSKAR